jgi:adenylate kinase family enzyme
MSRLIGEHLDLPVIFLDAHFWRPGWVEPEADDWQRRFAELAARSEWVMDGTFLSTIDAKLAAAELVVDVDLPRLLCLYRVLGRWLRYWGRTRPDMAPGCPEKVDWDFVRYIWLFGRRNRPRLDEAERASGKPVIRIRTRAEVRQFVEGLPATLGG